MAGIDITVQADTTSPLDLGATGLAEIAQNVRVIISTIRGQVFLDRTFGVPNDIVDMPTPKVRARIMNDIIGEIEKQEPRVQVTQVVFAASDKANGEVNPVVSVRVRPGVLL